MLKGNNIREKVQYFWMYYKLPFLAVLAAVLVLAYWVNTAASEKENALSVLFIDSHTAASEESMEKEFAEYADIPEDKEVSILTSLLFSDASSGTYAMTSLSRFYVEVGNEALDVCGMLEQDFEKYAKTDCFMDLRDCLEPELLESLKDSLLFYHEKPVGIYAHGLPVLLEDGCYEGDKAVVGIMYNTRNMGTAAGYMKYLAGGKEN